MGPWGLLALARIRDIMAGILSTPVRNLKVGRIG